jgi:hypothetical protein
MEGEKSISKSLCLSGTWVVFAVHAYPGLYTRPRYVHKNTKYAPLWAAVELKA